jgi:hypothetical protein
MALTTETSQQYSVNPPPRKISQEAAILLDKSVIARPLSAPEVASIRVKNTEYYYRWVNRMHANGRVYMERKAMGFTNATTDDVDVLVGDTVANEKELRSGDLILMKIPFGLWASHIKRNMQTAEVLQRMRGVHTKEEELSGSVFDEGGRAKHESVANELKGKVTNFIPDNPDALIDGQSSEDTQKAKDLVAEMRKRHQSKV